jgi:hypothetical protein
MFDLRERGVGGEVDDRPRRRSDCQVVPPRDVTPVERGDAMKTDSIPA